MVTGVSPAYGPTTGGTVVTITGSGFTGATAVTFGGIAAEVQVVVGRRDHRDHAAKRAAGDPYDVRVTTPNGISAVVAPTRSTSTRRDGDTSVSPVNGPRAGGNVGDDHRHQPVHRQVHRGRVKFGGVPATVVNVKSDSTIVATAPAGTGTVDVTRHDAGRRDRHVAGRPVLLRGAPSPPRRPARRRSRKSSALRWARRPASSSPTRRRSPVSGCGRDIRRDLGRRLGQRHDGRPRTSRGIATVGKLDTRPSRRVQHPHGDRRRPRRARR